MCFGFWVNGSFNRQHRHECSNVASFCRDADLFIEWRGKVVAVWDHNIKVWLETAPNIVFLTFSSDRPDPPASQPVVSQLSTQSLVLSWTGPSYDGGTAVLGYVLEVQQECLDKPGSWTEVASRCKSTSYHVRSGLEPQGQYRFRVRAYNSAGVSEPSQESECIKMATASKCF